MLCVTRCGLLSQKSYCCVPIYPCSVNRASEQKKTISVASVQLLSIQQEHILRKKDTHIYLEKSLPR